MKNLMSFFAVLLLSISTLAQTQWKVDPAHSSINFNITHSGISIVNGKFLDYNGSMTTYGEALTGAQFDFTVQVKSLDTSVAQRDSHLRTADFFDVEKYPVMTFKSTRMVANGNANQYLLYGKLTIKNVTKNVVFNITYGGTAKSDKGEKIGLQAFTTINRFDYNINYDPTATALAKDVTIIAHFQFAKQ